MKTKILVAYYSWGGNTGKIAASIAAKTGADVFEIQPDTPYSSVYNTVVEQAKEEIKNGFKPPLKIGKNIDEYDVVFIGSPNWWSTVAPLVETFMGDNKFAGKKVIPFCTHGGGGAARCFADTAKACPGAQVMPGIALYDDGGKDAQNKIEIWLQTLGI